MAAQQQRRLAAILMADIVGYSRLMGVDEAGTITRLQTLRSDVIEPVVAAHGARIVKTLGDGFFVEVPSAVDAVNLAAALQEGAAPSGLQLRIGVNLGDVVLDGDDLLGDGVNVAARLQELAAPGEICVSAKIRDEAQGRAAFAFEDIGEKALKNIAQPVRIYRLHPASGERVGAAPDVRAAPDLPSIMVLPFQNMSGDPDQEYFVDGVVEEITTALSRLKWLFVIARNSAFTYKGKAIDVRQVGRDLGVRYVLEGSVRKAASRVRITAQLIEVASGAHLWADRFDGSLEDIFELHDRVATEVAGAVEPNLREAEINRSLRKPTTSLDAYDLYMRAMAAFREPSVANLQAAMDLTGRVIALDPRFARALAVRATCFLHLHTEEAIDPAVVAEALRLAHAALAAASDDWEATSFAAMVIALIGGDIDTALAGSERALMLNPNGFLALNHNGWVQCAAGRPEAAIEPLTRALRLSPRDPLRGYCEMALAVAYRDSGRPQEALIWGRRAMLSQPLLQGGYRVVAAALVDLGRIDEARGVVRQLLTADPAARVRPAFIRRQNRNEATVTSLISALRAAGLPD